MVIIPEWARWIREGRGYPACCYTCDMLKDGICSFYDAEPPTEFCEECGKCEYWCAFDDIPF